MANLKTDDILGARPRVRHAPRSLIRQQKLAHQHEQSSYPYAYADDGRNNGQGYNYQYPYNGNGEGRYGQGYQDQPYMNNGQPRFSKQINMSESYMEKSPTFAGKSSDRIHDNINVIDRYDEQIKNRASQRLFIKPKQAPVISYDHLQNVPRNSVATTYTRAYNGNNKDLYQNYNYRPKGNNIESIQLNKSRQIKSYQIPKVEAEKRRSSSSINTSKDSSSVQKNGQNAKTQERQSKNKNIFRGLGYNIITNSKFQYGMENRYLNNVSKWLD